MRQKMYRKTITILLTLVALMGQAKVKKSIVWEQPLKAYTVDPSFEVQKVELTKEKTILYARYRGLPKGEFRIQDGSYLQTNGKQYAIIGSDSIALGKGVVLDDSGKKDFVLYFRPLPKKTNEFDFIEGLGDDDFKVYGIVPGWLWQVGCRHLLRSKLVGTLIRTGVSSPSFY